MQVKLLNFSNTVLPKYIYKIPPLLKNKLARGLSAGHHHGTSTGTLITTASVFSFPGFVWLTFSLVDHTLSNTFFGQIVNI